MLLRFFKWVRGVIEINLAATMPEQTSISNTRRNIIHLFFYNFGVTVPKVLVNSTSLYQTLAPFAGGKQYLDLKPGTRHQSKFDFELLLLW